MKELVYNHAGTTSSMNSSMEEGVGTIAIVLSIIIFLITLWFVAQTTETELEPATIIFFTIFGWGLNLLIYFVKVHANVKKEMLKLRRIETEVILKQENSKPKTNTKK